MKLFEQSLHIWSPGILPFEISIDDLLDSTHASKPRNKLIAQVFFEMGMIERYGGGIQRIFDQCKMAGLPKPEFEQTQGGLRVHFQSPPQAIGGGVTEEETEGVMMLYQLISKEPGQRVPSLAENMGTSPKNIERWLKQLKDEGKSGLPRFLRNLAKDR